MQQPWPKRKKQRGVNHRSFRAQLVRYRIRPRSLLQRTFQKAQDATKAVYHVHEHSIRVYAL